MAPAGILRAGVVIYASETYAGALLEILAHASGSVPR
jgi:hypothetical protein